jgi:pyruvate/2-oxoglutarate dehydrogenase complex dihydrolipoamide acyltransferase (E2) component
MAVTVFQMSQISMTMVEGRVVKWLKQEQEPIQEGEGLVEIETDKIVVEITSPAAGVVRKIMVPEGEYAAVGAPLCLIADRADDISAYVPGQAAAAGAATSAPAVVAEAAAEPVPERKIKASPLARKIAASKGVRLDGLTGTGPGGLIVRFDVEQAMARVSASAATAEAVVTPAVAPATTAAPSSTDDVEIIPLQGVRKRIAEHLTLSKQNAADVTTVMDVNMTKVASLRKVLSVSYTVFVVRAAAVALQEFPLLNASIVNNSIHVKKQINVNVAVATDTGLVTPVIRHTNRKNILTVAAEMDELARKARDGGLQPADFADGTFTVTNSGTFGSLLFTPIINYPQCAILGIGKVAKTPVVVDDAIVAAPVMYLCLTYDHRLVDGETAVKFLKSVKTYLEQPEQILK